jgi:hypothetical protein
LSGRPFRPSAWSVGGHRQTLLGYWLRRGLRWTLPAEDLIVPVDGAISVLARASWQPGRPDDRPAVVLVHGLGGWDGAPYAVAAGLHAFSRGWHVVRMNMRGARRLRDPVPVPLQRGPRLRFDGAARDRRGPRVACRGDRVLPRREHRAAGGRPRACAPAPRRARHRRHLRSPRSRALQRCPGSSGQPDLRPVFPPVSEARLPGTAGA